MGTSKTPKLCVTLHRQNAHLLQVNSASASVASLDFGGFNSSQMERNFRLVIFDLDGTLLDTLSDLAISANDALVQCGFPVHPTEDYKQFIGDGTAVFMERILPKNQKNEQTIAHVMELFLSNYYERMVVFTKPFDGIPELLKALLSKGLKIAVASNKPQQATEKLIGQLFPDISFAVVLGQREGIPPKPNPAIVHEILKITGHTPAEAIYVGDSGVDMLTASNSGVHSIGVTWGYRSREELESTGATYIAGSAEEILELTSPCPQSNNGILPLQLTSPCPLQRGN